MSPRSNQPVSTLRDTILASTIKLGLMPWLIRLMLAGRRCQGFLATRLSTAQSSEAPSSATAETSTDTGTVQDHGISSTWYAWFDDNLDDFYTADPLADFKPIEPTHLVSALLENNVTLWHHPEFAPWLVTFAEQAFYQWPAEIPVGTDLTQPEHVCSPETQQKLSLAFKSLPQKLAHRSHIQELVLMYLGASYTVIEQFSKTPIAQAVAKERERYHQEHYAKRTAFYQQHGMTVQEYIEQNEE